MKIYDVRGIGASLTGSFSGSFKGLFTGPLDGVAATSSYVQYSNVANKPALVSGSSQVSFSGITNKPTLISGSAQIAALGYATTSTNVFQGNQTITGSLFITQNLVVAGSSSIQYITSSNLDIADNIITVNVLNPSVRFGGLGVIDSGSSPQRSGSLLFDSIKDEWLFVHQNQSVVTSSVLLMGPETYNNLGNETYLSANRLPKGSGVEHLRDSNITDTGTVVSINSNTRVTGSLNISGSITVNGVSASFSEYVPYTGATAEVNLGTNSMYSSMVYINGDGTGGGGVLNLKKGSTRVIGGNDAANTVSLWSDTAAFGFNDWVSANVRSAKFSLASISNNQTRTYTLPNETGTLALTSNLSAYLPLTGGTLTGALSGTSALFTSTITSNNAIGVEKNGSGTFGSGGRFYLYNAATTDGLLIQLNASNNIDYWGVTSNTPTASPVITFTRAGEATFSSSVTAGALSRIGDVFIAGRSGTYATYSDGIFGGNNLHLGVTAVGGRVFINTELNRNLIINPVGGNVSIGTTDFDTSNGNAGVIFKIASNNNNLIIGETSTTNRYLIIESRRTGRSGGVRYAQISLGGEASDNGEIQFHTAQSGAGISERMVITPTGVVRPGANGTQDLGTSSLRWATVYTSDLSLSNGIGDYTIVEGEHDLFLYNNKNNKVYKFLVEEVDPSTATPKKS